MKVADVQSFKLNVGGEDIKLSAKDMSKREVITFRIISNLMERLEKLEKKVEVEDVV